MRPGDEHGRRIQVARLPPFPRRGRMPQRGKRGRVACPRPIFVSCLFLASGCLEGHGPLERLGFSRLAVHVVEHVVKALLVGAQEHVAIDGADAGRVFRAALGMHRRR